MNFNLMDEIKRDATQFAWKTYSHGGGSPVLAMRLSFPAFVKVFDSEQAVTLPAGMWITFSTSGEFDCETHRSFVQDYTEIKTNGHNQ